MKIISWNVNGLRSIVQKGFERFLIEENPDCVCIQEVKAQKEQLSSEHLAPNQMLADFCESARKGYSGVATFLKPERSSADSSSLIQTGIGDAAIDSEGRVLVHRLQIGSEELFIANCYFPSGTSGELRQEFKYYFLDKLYSFIDTLPKSIRKSLIVCGDFNICHKELDIHHPNEAEKRGLSGFLPKERAWMDSFVKLGFTDSFRHCHSLATDQYSWWTFRAGARVKNKGWRIDYIFVADELKHRIKNAWLLPDVFGSDHCPAVLELH
jgi:exodeoxyribonuclease III